MQNKLAEVRKKKLMTQKELAEKSNVSRSTIIAIEKNCLKSINTKTLLKLANALGVTVDCIFFN